MVQPAFKPSQLGRKDASGQIAKQLRSAIASSVWKPGEQLPTEQELADTFDVSRSTAREGLKLLSATGLVISSRGTNGGNFVAVPDAEMIAEQLSDSIGLWYRSGNVSLLEVDEARWVLEMHSVDLAARRRTEDDLVVIKKAVDASRDLNMDIAEWLDLDLDFHTAISKAAKNQILELAMMAVHLSRPATNTVFVDLDRRSITAQHYAIYEAIAERDPEKAKDAFQCHIDGLNATRREALEKMSASDLPVATLPAIRSSVADTRGGPQGSR